MVKLAIFADCIESQSLIFWLGKKLKVRYNLVTQQCNQTLLRFFDKLKKKLFKLIDLYSVKQLTINCERNRIHCFVKQVISGVLGSNKQLGTLVRMLGKIQ